MGVQKTTVVVEVDGEQQAAAAARRLEATADRVSAKADQAKAKVREADLAGRKLSLLDRARANGLIRGRNLAVGPVQVGANGFRINPRLMTAGIAAYGVGAIFNAGSAGIDTLERASDWMDQNPGATRGQALVQMAREAYGGTFASNPATQFVAKVARWFKLGEYARMDSQQASDYIAQGNLEFFGARGPVDEAIDAQRLASREAAKIRRQQDVEDAAAAAKKRSAFDAAMEKIDQALAAKTAGMRAPQLPIRVPDAMWHEMQQSAKERERRRAEILKQRISAGAGS